MVRLVVPRFFRRGDEIVLSTIVQNYLPMEKTAQVSMEFTGLQVIDGGTKDVQVPSRGLAKVDYRVRVLDVDSAKVLGEGAYRCRERRDGADAAGRAVRREAGSVNSDCCRQERHHADGCVSAGH